MSNTDITTGNSVNPPARLSGFIYTIITTGNIILNISGISSAVPAIYGLLSLASIAVPFLTMLVFYLHLTALGENANKGALLIIIPSLASLFSGYIFNNPTAALYSVFGFLAPTLACAVIYNVSRKSTLSSEACAFSSFILLAADLLLTAIVIFSVSAEKSLSFNTVVFESLNAFMDEVAAMYNSTLASVSTVYGEYGAPVDISMYMVDAESLKSMLIPTIALTPAVIYAMYFFMTYLFTKIVDIVCVWLGLTEEKSFGKFRITSVTNTFFSICVFVIMLSVLFESGISAFSCGMFSVLIILIPNYIILGIRRLFGKFSGVMPKAVAALIVSVIIFSGLFISPYILVLVIVCFGTSEYRASKREGNT